MTFRNKNGITLLSLVVTVIVMLILAGTSMYLVLGNNGIINKTFIAKTKDENSAVFDAIQMKMDNISMQQYFGEEINKFEVLKKDGYINSAGIVNVDTLMSGSISTGRGSVNKDVYIVEIENNKYVLDYYDDNGNVTRVGNLSDAD